MAAAITGVEKVGASAWRYTYTGTGPFAIYLRGELIQSNRTLGWYIIDRPGYETEPPALEVIDSTETSADVATVARPGRAVLQWRGRSDLHHYLVQRWVDGDWADLAPLVYEDGRGYHKFDAGEMVDGPTVEQYRVIGVDAQGNEGPGIESQLVGIRVPEPPQVSVAYSAVTKKFTVSAA